MTKKNEIQNFVFLTSLPRVLINFAGSYLGRFSTFRYLPNPKLVTEFV